MSLQGEGTIVREANDGLPAKTRQFVLAALIIGMAITASLLITQIPPFFSSDGGVPVVAGPLALLFVAFTVRARRVRPSASS